eukprot:scaffold5668_cov111-Isochrysis_galbana.AAC.4
MGEWAAVGSGNGRSRSNAQCSGQDVLKFHDTYDCDHIISITQPASNGDWYEGMRAPCGVKPLQHRPKYAARRGGRQTTLGIFFWRSPHKKPHDTTGWSPKQGMLSTCARRGHASTSHLTRLSGLAICGVLHVLVVVAVHAGRCHPGSLVAVHRSLGEWPRFALILGLARWSVSDLTVAPRGHELKRLVHLLLNEGRVVIADVIENADCERRHCLLIDPGE